MADALLCGCPHSVGDSIVHYRESNNSLIVHLDGYPEKLC